MINWIEFPPFLSISLEYPNNSKQARQSKFLAWQVKIIMCKVIMYFYNQMLQLLMILK